MPNRHISHIRPILMLSFFVAVVPLATRAPATTYYVRTTGNDNNSGTAPNQAWGTVQKAATSTTAGDLIYVGAGTYNQRVAPSVDGTAADPIRFFADTTGAYTGDAGVSIITTSSTTRPVIYLRNDDYIHFNGFRIQGGAYGVRLRNGTGWLLENCEITGASNAGVYAQSGQTTLIGCTIYNSNNDGVRVNGAELTLVSCDIRDNADEGILVLSSSILSVSDSTITNNADQGLQAVNSGCTVTVDRSFLNQNGGEGFRVNRGTATLVNCQVANNAEEGILVRTSGSTNLTLWNCTVVGNVDGLEQDGGTVTLTNSIFAFNSDDGLDRDGGTMNHTFNLLYGNSNNDYEGTTAGSGEVSGDPLFEDLALYDYHLRDGSAAVDAGADATGIVDDDLEGTLRPFSRAWDLGCYESPFAGAGGGWRMLQWVEIDNPGP